MIRAVGRRAVPGWTCLVVLLCLAGPVSAQPEARTLRVCADPNNLPYSSRDGTGLENALAQLIARDLGWRVEYAWWPQRRGFIRNTLKAGRCDVVLGLPTGFELADLTEPYYTSSYVFVTRHQDALGDLRSLDDPRLRRLRIGLHAIGDDYANVPPAEALGRRGITSNVVGYSIYGDYSRPDPPRELIDAVARGDVDVAIAWGPLAGYFAERAPVPLVVTPIEAGPDRVGEDPMRFSIAAGVRHGDEALKRTVQGVLDRRRSDVQALLAAYHVPLVEPAARARPASAGIEPVGGRIYVTNERSGELSVIDGDTRAVVATVPLGKRPRGMQLSPDGRRLYVALSGSPIGGPQVDESKLPPPDKQADGIGVVDVASLRLLRVMRGVSDPEQLALSRDGRKLYVASEDTGTAVVLNESDGRLLATLTVGHEPEGIATSPDGRWVYVASEAEDEVSVIDTRDDSIVANVRVCARPRAIVFSTRAAEAFVSCENDASVAVLDTRRHVEVARLAVPGEGARPMGLALSPDGARLYVATGRGGRLVAFDTTARQVSGSVEVGPRPWGITLSSDGRWLYTANGPSNDVSVVDANRLDVVDKVTVRASPWGALADDTRRASHRATAATSSVPASPPDADQRGAAGSGTMR